MALFVKDPEVDALAQELAALKRTSKTEAVRQALRSELDRERDKLDLVAQSLAFARGLRDRAGPNPQPVDKAFRDRLYGDP
ncbi:MULTISPECIES: type II toxin-antitoxin system VapB family antitoxin [Methylobacterium]|jgi:antitoxin VapB|uniref:Transcription factor n=1 Tax=Methylobacterium aquaticum TaxID=270351 RepID=A0A0J6SMF7_9HYPH|nr:MULTISPECIES: type II toxin-antitoxin system VapB family antitoxin [Methylobacterium]KMO34827.1 transcription factor [Methylobacterium aquaticum]MBY0258189.1 type II toxin-antitoxin system VapB family antitoxin [Methylobacterium sp.]